MTFYDFAIAIQLVINIFLKITKSSDRSVSTKPLLIHNGLSSLFSPNNVIPILLISLKCLRTYVGSCLKALPAIPLFFRSL